MYVADPASVVRDIVERLAAKNGVKIVDVKRDAVPPQRVRDFRCLSRGVDEVALRLAKLLYRDSVAVLARERQNDLSQNLLKTLQSLAVFHPLGNSARSARTQHDNLAAENFRLRKNGLEIFTHRCVALRSFEKPDISRKHSVESRAKNANSVRGTPGLPEFFVGFMFKSTKRRLKAVAAALLHQRDLGNFPAVAGSYLHKTISFFRLRFILPQKRLFGNDFQSF